MRLIVRLLLIIHLIVAVTFTAYSDIIEEQIEATETALNTLIANNATLLSPINLEKAERFFKRAQKSYAENKDTATIEEELQEANEAIAEANRVLELSEQLFEAVLSARENCQTVEAAQHAAELFDKAESKFNGAVTAMEAGKLDKAKERVAEAESFYRDAELNTIKLTIIGKVRDTIKEAEEKGAGKYAPFTLQHAVDLADEAENILNNDRYAGAEAQEKAEQAGYETRHAMYITNRAQSLEIMKDGYESLFLEIEGYVGRVATSVNYDPYYDRGLGDPMIEIAQTIKAVMESMRADNRRLNQAIMEKNQENEELRTNLNEARNELAQLKGEYETEKERRRLEEEAKQLEEEKFQRIYGMFEEGEAVVLFEDQNLILRLTGLQFHSGKSTIQPESFSILGKVLSIVQEFPGNEITIEGHTDSFGRNSANQALSEERARAVLQYLLSSSPNLSPAVVTSIGYGEENPIASNETKEGRAMNRRIEVVIKGAKKL